MNTKNKPHMRALLYTVSFEKLSGDLPPRSSLGRGEPVAFRQVIAANSGPFEEAAVPELALRCLLLL